MAKPRGFTKADEQLWAAFVQNIAPLPGKTKIPHDLPPPPVQAAPPGRAISEPSAKPAARPIHVNLAPPGLDKSTWKSFASGKRRPERKLDLHGLTATRAHHAVTSFIQNGHANGLRCLEIVTGRGEILARELPHWLNLPGLRPLILAVAYAPTANTGAVRILLRRGTQERESSYFL